MQEYISHEPFKNSQNAIVVSPRQIYSIDEVKGYKNIIFKTSDLTQVQFLKTSLKGIDFSDSKIEGIAVSIEDIKGAIINQFQAIDLLYLIGVKIK